MKKIIPFFLLLSFLLPVNTNAQVLVNREWVELTGNPDGSNPFLSDWDQIDWTNSALDGQENLLVVGNTLQAAGNTDIITTKFDRDGGVLWEKTFAGPTNGYDYGVALSLDNQDNVFVAGVVSTASGQSAVQLIKYNSNGSLLWSSLWGNNVGNLYDLPTSITLDDSGNIIVIGATINSALKTDWILLKFDPTGSLLWDKTFDYAGHHDLPTQVVVNPSNDIEVLGFSENAPASVNFVRVAFSGSSGLVLSQEAKYLSEISGSSPTSVALDANQNFYIAGTSNDLNNTDIKLIKINSAYEIEWIKTIDAEGLEDIAKSVVVDKSGNVIVAGESKNEKDGHYFTIEKYTPDGEELFKVALDGYLDESRSSIQKIKVNDNNDVFVLAEITSWNESQATLEGYFYHVEDASGNDLGWIPFDFNNLSQDAHFEYSIIAKDKTVAFDEVEEITTFELYPNPVSSILTIDLDTEKAINISVYIVSSEGRIVNQVFDGNTIVGKNHYEYSVENLPAGTYYVFLKGAGSPVTKPFIKH